MPALKVMLIAMKVHRTWRRIPPAQRRAMLAAAQNKARAQGPAALEAVRKHGPTVSKRVAEAVRNSRKRP
ncbi:MAG TPA: hypothetical protein VH650_13135 [Gaiellaceae bacterium]|jgi:hypothetical protein